MVDVGYRGEAIYMCCVTCVGKRKIKGKGVPQIQGF